RRHTRCLSDWSSDVCSSDLGGAIARRIAPLLRPASSPTQRAIRLTPYCALRLRRPNPHVVVVEDGAAVGRGLEGARQGVDALARSEERRVGKGWRWRGALES